MRKKIVLPLIILAVLIIGIFIWQKTTSKDSSVKEPATTGKGTDTSQDDSDDTCLIGFSCADMSDPYAQAQEASLRGYAQDYGATLITRDAKGDQDRQNRDLDKFAEDRVDAVVITPVSYDGPVEKIVNLQNLNIKIIVLDLKISDMSLADCYITTNKYSAGALCAAHLTKEMPDGGEVLIFESSSVQTNADGISGFETELAGKGFTVAARVDSRASQSDACKKTDRILSDGIRADAVMCGSDSMALGVIEAYENYNETHEDKQTPLVYSVGASPQIKALIGQEGSLIAASATLNPLAEGQEAAAAALSLISGGKAEEEIIIRPYLIDRGNIELYGKDGWQ